MTKVEIADKLDDFAREGGLSKEAWGRIVYLSHMLRVEALEEEDRYEPITQPIVNPLFPHGYPFIVREQ